LIEWIIWQVATTLMIDVGETWFGFNWKVKIYNCKDIFELFILFVSNILSVKHLLNFHSFFLLSIQLSLESKHVKWWCIFVLQFHCKEREKRLLLHHDIAFICMRIQLKRIFFSACNKRLNEFLISKFEKSFLKLLVKLDSALITM
jgi:hypothetical protein